MAKAVLVMNYMPTRCCDCDLENDVKINKTICHVSLRDISDSEKTNCADLEGQLSKK